MKNDETRLKERFEILVKLVNQEFPDASIREIQVPENKMIGWYCDWAIRIEKNNPLVIIILQPSDDSLMVDENINFKNIFAEGIKEPEFNLEVQRREQLLRLVF